MAELTKRGLGVHQIPQAAREKIMPVALRIVTRTVPTSAAARAIRSQAQFSVFKKAILATNSTTKHNNEQIALGT